MGYQNQSVIEPIPTKHFEFEPTPSLTPSPEPTIHETDSARYVPTTHTARPADVHHYASPHPEHFRGQGSDLNQDSFPNQDNAHFFNFPENNEQHISHGQNSRHANALRPSNPSYNWREKYLVPQSTGINTADPKTTSAQFGQNGISDLDREHSPRPSRMGNIPRNINNHEILWVQLNLNIRLS